MNNSAKTLEGAVCVDKRLLNHTIWQRSDYGHAWITLLLLANDRDRKVPLSRGTVEVKRGQCAHSKASLQKRLGRGRKWLTAFLDFCIEAEMIKVQSFPDWSVITILNYDAYNKILLQLQGASYVEIDSARSGPTKQPERDPARTYDLIEIVDRDELELFCRSFKDPARGIAKIPYRFAVNWLEGKVLIRSGLAKDWDWQGALTAAFLEACARGDRGTKLSRNGHECLELQNMIDSEIDNGRDVTSLLTELQEFVGPDATADALVRLWELGRLAVKVP